MKLSKVNGSFVKSVGFIKPLGQARKQKRWYLGTSEPEAILLAAKLQTAWKESANVGESSEGPVWREDFSLDRVEEQPEATLDRLQTEGKVLSIGDNEHGTTIAAALTWFAAQKQGRMKLRNRSNIKQSTVMRSHYNLKAALLPFPQFELLSQLDEDGLKTIHDYWMGSDHSNRPNAHIDTISERTAINYLNTLKTFLRLIATNAAFDYDLPKVLGAWRFSLKKAEVIIPTTEELAIIFANSSQRMKCFLLIALNAGQLSNDIGRMNHEDVTINNGHSVIRKVRLKTGSVVTYKGSWQLWPETVAAIKANKVEGGELLFLNQDGKPLYDVKATSKSDAIGDEFHRITRKLIKYGQPIRSDVTFSTIRAYGASHIASMGKSEYFAKLYLCHSVASGATQAYIDAQYEPLQPLLKKLRGLLKNVIGG